MKSEEDLIKSYIGIWVRIFSSLKTDKNAKTNLLYYVSTYPETVSERNIKKEWLSSIFQDLNHISAADLSNVLVLRLLIYNFKKIGDHYKHY